jgi:glycosyltransferase involved in cell wall biosynthesis
MRIGINVLSLDSSFVGGLNTFTRGLLDGFAAVAHGHDFQVYATTGNLRLFDPLRKHKNFEIVALDESAISWRRGICRASLAFNSSAVFEATSNRVFREVRRIMDRDNDIVYTPSVVLQTFDNHKPTVLSMHDIQHVHYPEFFTWPRRLSRRITYGLSARHANVLQASSEFIKQDLFEHFKCISPDKIKVIPEGVRIEDFATRMDTSFLSAKYGIPERFIFYPAQLWPHKNHIALLQVLKRMEVGRGLQIPLVLTGGKYSGASKVLDYVADHSMKYVHYLGRVPFEDLVGLYQQAAYLIMPSLHESNSLPILEASAAGTPIIASNIPPNEELARVLQLNLFDPLNLDCLEEVLFRLWSSGPEAMAAQVAHNRKHIAIYSWESAAEQYLQLFERMSKSSAGN